MIALLKIALLKADYRQKLNFYFSEAYSFKPAIIAKIVEKKCNNKASCPPPLSTLNNVVNSENKIKIFLLGGGGGGVGVNWRMNGRFLQINRDIIRLSSL